MLLTFIYPGVIELVPFSIDIIFSKGYIVTSWIKRNNSCYQKVQAFCCVHDYFIKIVVSLRTRVVKEKERARLNISFCWLYYIVSTIPCKKSWATVLIKDDFSVSDIFVFFYPTILHKIVGSLPPPHTLCGCQNIIEQFFWCLHFYIVL